MKAPAVSASVRRVPIGITCPACGNDGSRGAIRFVASATSSAEIVAFRRDVLELVAAVGRSGDATFPYLRCKAPVEGVARECDRAFPVPTSLVGIAWRFA